MKQPFVGMTRPNKDNHIVEPQVRLMGYKILAQHWRPKRRIKAGSLVVDLMRGRMGTCVYRGWIKGKEGNRCSIDYGKRNKHHALLGDCVPVHPVGTFIRDEDGNWFKVMSTTNPAAAEVSQCFVKDDANAANTENDANAEGAAANNTENDANAEGGAANNTENDANAEGGAANTENDANAEGANTENDANAEGGAANTENDANAEGAAANTENDANAEGAAANTENDANAGARAGSSGVRGGSCVLQRRVRGRGRGRGRGRVTSVAPAAAAAAPAANAEAGADNTDNDAGADANNGNAEYPPPTDEGTSIYVISAHVYVALFSRLRHRDLTSTSYLRTST